MGENKINYKKVSQRLFRIALAVVPLGLQYFYLKYYNDLYLEINTKILIISLVATIITLPYIIEVYKFGLKRIAGFFPLFCILAIITLIFLFALNRTDITELYTVSSGVFYSYLMIKSEELRGQGSSIRSYLISSMSLNIAIFINVAYQNSDAKNLAITFLLMSLPTLMSDIIRRNINIKSRNKNKSVQENIYLGILNYIRSNAYIVFLTTTGGQYAAEILFFMKASQSIQSFSNSFFASTIYEISHSSKIERDLKSLMKSLNNLFLPLGLTLVIGIYILHANSLIGRTDLYQFLPFISYLIYGNSFAVQQVGIKILDYKRMRILRIKETITTVTSLAVIYVANLDLRITYIIYLTIMLLFRYIWFQEIKKYTRSMA